MHWSRFGEAPFGWPRVAWTALLAFVLATGCSSQNGEQPYNGPKYPDNAHPIVEPSLRGQFTRIAGVLPHAGSPDPTTLVDCDADGLLDILRVKHGELLHQQSDGTFASVALPQSGRRATLTDVDQDGRPDLVIENQQVFVYRAEDACRFSSTPLWSLPGCTSASPAASLRAEDLNSDGLGDFALSCLGPTGTTPYVFLLANGDGTFERQEILGDALGNVPQTGLFVFNQFFHDVDGDGLLDGFFLSDANAGWFAWGSSMDPPRFMRDDRLSQRFIGLNPMSVSPLDADRDGRIDYFLAGANDNLLFWHRGERNVFDVGRPAGIGNPLTSPFQVWTSLAFDADYDGWMDVLALRLEGTPQSPGGEKPARPHFYMNRRNGSFSDVAAAGANFNTQGYTMSCGDLRSEGRISCYVEGFHSIDLLRNEIEPSRPWAGVRLRRTISGPMSIGATVSVDGASPPLVYLASTQAGTYADHKIDVLMPANENGLTSVTIQWPSGVEQRVSDLPASTYTIVNEPEVFLLSHRVAPADGKTRVEVILRPELLGTRVATVELDGAGTWDHALTPVEGGMLRTLIAPSTPGVARLNITIGGKPLRVRPRVIFK